MDEIEFEAGSGNVFADLGYSPAEAADLTAENTLIETHGPRALGEFLELKLEDAFPIGYDVHSVCKGDPAAFGR